MPTQLPRLQIDLDALRQSFLFADLDTEQFLRVSTGCRLVELRDGEYLFEQGRPAKEFFLLRSGQIKLTRVSAEGDEKVFDIVNPGQTFAEAVMFLGGDIGYPVNGSAVAASQVYCFDGSVFLDVLGGSVDTCFRLMARMSQRLHWQVNEIDRLTLHNATYRLVTYLLEQLPRDSLGRPQVQLMTPKNVIASRLSIQPETFSRILGRLEQKGLIEVRDHFITLCDVEGVCKLARVAPV